MAGLRLEPCARGGANEPPVNELIDRWQAAKGQKGVCLSRLGRELIRPGHELCLVRYLRTLATTRNQHSIFFSS